MSKQSDVKTYKLTEKQVATVAAKMRTVQEAEALARSYVSGLADALDVPAGYHLDMKSWAFVPAPIPPKE